VDPPFSDLEILSAFRAGSFLITKTWAEITQKGLQIVPLPGGEPLPVRLRDAHAEIRPGLGMTRSQFKQTLQELE